MELLQLRYFQKVAELESMTRTADYYGIPQSSVSQTIARLERELGTKLFDRRGGKLFLNEQGKRFLAHVEQALQNLDNGVSAVTEVPDRISGPVRIKIMDCHRLILTCVPRFSRLYPEVSISLSHGYGEDRDTSYDLCVSSHRAYRNMTAHRPLLQETVVLAVHENHPLARRNSVGIADLKGEKLISLPPQSSLHALTVESCRACGFEPHIPILCDDPYFIRKYVSEEMGVALAPSISWKGRFRPNTRLVPLGQPPLQVCSYLLWDDKRYLSPAVCRFRDYLLEEAEKLAETGQP